MSLNFSKWALLAALLLTIGSAVAMHGGTMSAGARISYHNMNMQGHGQINVADPFARRDFRNNFGGVGGDLFIAREKMIMGGDYSVGGELFIGVRTTDTGQMVHLIAALVLKTTVQQDYSFGGRFKFGKSISSDVTLYGSLGVLGSSFVITNAGTGSLLFPGSATRKTLLGIAPGVGVKVKLTPSWCYHIDASYTFYDDFKTEVLHATNATRYDVKIRPREAGLSFGFSRKF